MFFTSIVNRGLNTNFCSMVDGIWESLKYK